MIVLVSITWERADKRWTILEILVNRTRVSHKTLRAHLLFLALVTLAVLQTATGSWAGSSHTETWCDQVKNELEEKRQRLNEYLQALQAYYDKRDFRLSETLNYKIKQINQELRILEQEVADCSARGSRSMQQGLRETKSDEEKYATKSCGELRSLVLPLLRKTQALKRKEKSLLAGPTPEEAAELAEASEQLSIIARILKTRCAPSEARSSLLKRLRR